MLIGFLTGWQDYADLQDEFERGCSRLVRTCLEPDEPLIPEIPLERINDKRPSKGCLDGLVRR